MVKQNRIGITIMGVLLTIGLFFLNVNIAHAGFLDWLFGGKENKATTLTLMSTETDTDSIEITNRIIRKFEEKNLDVHVQVEFLEFDAIYPKVIAGIAAGNPPDVIGIMNTSAASLAFKGQLEPVTDIIDSFSRDDWMPISLIRYKDEDWYVPYAVAVLGIYIRTDLFNGSNLTTWQNFLDACEQFDSDTDNDGKVDIYCTAIPFGTGGATSNFFLTQLFSNEGHIFDEDNNVVFDKSPYKKRAVETLNFLKKLSKYSPPGTLNYTWKDLTASYYSKSVASTYYGPRVLALVNKFSPDIDSVTDGFVYPYGKKPATTMIVDGWAITKGSKNIKLAKELIKELISGKNYIDFLHTVPLHLTPPRFSVSNSQEYLENPLIQRHPETRKTISTLIKNAVNFAAESGTLNPISGDVLTSNIIDEMVQRVIADNLEPGKAVDEASDRIRQLQRNVISKIQKRQ